MKKMLLKISYYRKDVRLNSEVVELQVIIIQTLAKINSLLFFASEVEAPLYLGFYNGYFCVFETVFWPFLRLF